MKLLAVEPLSISAFADVDPLTVTSTLTHKGLFAVVIDATVIAADIGFC